MKTHYPVIQLLRAIAASMICIFHFGLFQRDGYFLFTEHSLVYKICSYCNESIFLFFVISGFVMTLSLAKAPFTVKDVPNYLRRRFIRIELPYIAVILLMLSIQWWFAFNANVEMAFNWKQFLYHIIYIIPFSDYPWYNIIFWSLAIEFQFYFLILLIHFVLNSSPNYGKLAFLLLFATTSFFVDQPHIVFHYSIIFAQGITLVYILNKQINPKIGVSILALMVIGTAQVFSIPTAIVCGFGVLAIAFWKTDARWFRPFGDQSYSLYLIHGSSGSLFLYYTLPLTDSRLERVGIFVAALLVSYLAAYCFWKLVENPAQRLSKRNR